MITAVEALLRQENVLSHRNHGILIGKLEKDTDGFAFTREILYKSVDPKTVLFLSGGRTPQGLYKELGEDGIVTPGAVGFIDERFGEPMHKNSNEFSLRETGFLRYLSMRGVPFYGILRQDLSREETAERYDQEVRSLYNTYRHHIGILGVGVDGHTAGLPALSSKLKIQNSKVYNTHDLVTDYDDKGGFYKERITMTFTGLSMLDLLIVLVFGEDKQQALEKMFADGQEEEIPSRFFKHPEIAKKTILLTDQSV